jgi:hypothetical protein
MRPHIAPLLLLLAVAACSAPPQKEIDLAQGAIDAARAAGAERYAPAQFSDATAALQQAHDAVAQGDYRLALTRALDAHDRAQEAARGAADGKAKARSDAESAMMTATGAIQQLQARIKGTEAARLPRRDLDAARKTAAAADAALQKARAALRDGDYLAAGAAVSDLPGQIAAAIGALEAAAAKKPARPIRRTR